MSTAKQVKEQFLALFETTDESKSVSVKGERVKISYYHQSQELARRVSQNPMRGSYFTEFLSLCDAFKRAAKLPINEIFFDQPKKALSKRSAEFSLQFLMPPEGDNNSRSLDTAYVENLYLRLSKGDCYQSYFRLPVLMHPDHMEYRYWQRAKDNEGQKYRCLLKYNTEEMAFAANYALAMTVVMRDHNELLSRGLNYVMIPHPKGFLTGLVRPVTDVENVRIVEPDVAKFNSENHQDLDTGQLFQRAVHGYSPKKQDGKFFAYQIEEAHKLVCEVGTFVGIEDAWEERKILRNQLMTLFEDQSFREGLSLLSRLQMSGAGYTIDGSVASAKVYSALRKLDGHVTSDAWQSFSETTKSFWEAKNKRLRQGFVVEAEKDEELEQSYAAYQEFLSRYPEFNDRKQIQFSDLSGNPVTPLAKAVKNSMF